MSQYAVEYLPTALAVLNDMPEGQMQQVVEHLVRFARNPHASGASKRGPDGMRVVCEVRDDVRCVVTINVAPLDLKTSLK